MNAPLFYIQFIDGDHAWTDGKRWREGSRPNVKSVWRSIQEQRPLLLADQRPPTAVNFDGVETILNPNFVKSVSLVPVFA